MNQSSRSYDFLWLSIALLFTVGLSFTLSIPSSDYWWFSRLGRDILANGAVPLVDTMGYSHAGEPIAYLPWLSGVIFWVLYNLGGATWTYLVRGLLIGISYGICWQIIRNNSGPRLAFILIIILALSSSNNWVVRPQLFAYPLFVLCVWALYHWQEGNDKYLFLLPVSIVLWVNLHGSFAFSFILAGSALLFGKGNRKKLLLTLLIMSIFTLINPRGWGIWQIIASEISTPSNRDFSVEWAPPINNDWQMNIFFGWLLVFTPIAAFSKNKLSFLEWVWFLGFGWLAFSALRFVIWFLILISIFSSKLLAQWTNDTVDKPVQKINPSINYSISLVFILFVLMFLPGVRDAWWKKAPAIYDLSTTPIAATEWLSENEKLPGPIWNDYAFGSYLEFALPSRPTWVDTRFYRFPPEELTEYGNVSNAENWQEMFDREGINLLMMSTERQPKLIKAVSSSDIWCKEYDDKFAVIFSRCEAIP